VTPILRHLGRRLVMQLYARPSLVLIAAAIVALSVASGERTFEGMKNFFEGMQNVAAAVILSALITFGVQILMVVLAWRIGEVLSTSSQVGTSAPSQQRNSFIGESGHLRRFISRQFWCAILH
jgi:chromate transport protein ChrA